MATYRKFEKKVFETFLPVVLFYLMTFTEQLIRLENYVGPDLLAQRAIKLFIFGIAGFFISGIFYPLVQKIAKKNRNLAKNMFYTLNYPVEYFFVSIMLFVFQAENLNPVVKSSLFIPALLSLSSFVQIFVKESICSKQKDIRQEVMQEEATRDISLFILVLISVMIFVKRV